MIVRIGNCAVDVNADFVDSINNNPFHGGEEFLLGDLEILQSKPRFNVPRNIPIVDSLRQKRWR